MPRSLPRQRNLLGEVAEKGGYSMCGIVDAIAQRDVTPLLLESLKRLEYRGYDSAGMAVLHPEQLTIQRIRTQGKGAIWSWQ